MERTFAAVKTTSRSSSTTTATGSASATASPAVICSRLGSCAGASTILVGPFKEATLSIARDVWTGVELTTGVGAWKTQNGSQQQSNAFDRASALAFLHDSLECWGEIAIAASRGSAGVAIVAPAVLSTRWRSIASLLLLFKEMMIVSCVLRIDEPSTELTPPPAPRF